VTVATSRTSTSGLPDPRTRGRKSDRRFFLRRPHRLHRFRVAFRGEAESFGAPPPPLGSRYFMAVRFMPGEHLFAVPLPLPFAPDVADQIGEAEAAILFETAAENLADVVRVNVEPVMPMEAGR
jgi:hypothetical protein